MKRIGIGMKDFKIFCQQRQPISDRIFKAHNREREILQNYTRFNILLTEWNPSWIFHLVLMSYIFGSQIYIYIHLSRTGSFRVVASIELHELPVF